MESKVCPSCGRRFEWRKRSEREWDSMRYCSAACRRGRSPARRAAAARAEGAILEMLASRAASSTICPSEVARVLDPESWRSSMELVRAAARRLAHAGRVEVRQHRAVVDPDRAKGPIRIGRGKGFDDRRESES